jgi:hypothetical protein
MLVKEDRGIVQYRRWFQQFYSGSSLSFAQAASSQSPIAW